MRYDDNGNPDEVPTCQSRALDLFEVIDKDSDGTLTFEEFIEAFTKRYKFG